MNQGTSKYFAKSKTFCTSLSDPTKSRGGPRVRAVLYCVHNGDPQIASGFPYCSICSTVTSRMLQQIVGCVFLSKSRLVHVQPCCSNTLEIDLVPQNNSSKCGIFCSRQSILPWPTFSAFRTSSQQ